MNFEQNNNLKNESLESNKANVSSPLQEMSNNDFSVSEQKLIDLKNKDEAETSLELAKIRESINGKSENDQELEKGFDLNIKEGETDFDFLGRLNNFLIYKQEDQDDKDILDSDKKAVCQSLNILNH